MPTTRRECYHRIRDLMQARVIKYYLKNPQLYEAQHSDEVVQEILDTLADVFNILDEYDIKKKSHDSHISSSSERRLR